MERRERPAPPELDGYLVHRLLGSGASSHVWAATAPDGSDVALKVVAGAGERAAVLREAVLLCQVHHPHVVAMRAVERSGDAVVLVLDRAAGGSLGALVRARGSLEVAEVVTVVTALAGALADLHAQGLVHGDVAPGNVLFTADATPLLADWGLAAVVGGPVVDGAVVGAGGGTPGFADPARPPGAEPTPAGDVHGLAAVAWYALAGQVPPPVPARVPLPLLVPGLPVALATLLDAATSPVPQRRPTAVELGTACAELVAGEPVHLVPSDPHAEPAELLTHRLRAAAAEAHAAAGPRRSASTNGGLWRGRPGAQRGSRRGSRRGSGADGPERAPRGAGWRRAGQGLVGFVAAAAIFTGAWAVSARVFDVGPGARALAADTAPLSAEEAVTELAAQRARAYLEADVDLLAGVDAPTSPAEAVDRAAIGAMVEEGSRVRGLAYDVRWAEEVPIPAGADGLERGAVAVRAVVATSAYEQVMSDGSVVAVPASGPVTSLLLLERHDGGWLLSGTA